MRQSDQIRKQTRYRMLATCASVPPYIEAAMPDTENEQQPDSPSTLDEIEARFRQALKRALDTHPSAAKKSAETQPDEKKSKSRSKKS